MAGPRSMNAAQAIAALEEAASEAPREVLPQILGELERVKSSLFLRLMSPTTEATDELLTAREAAPLVGVSHHTLLRNAQDYPFTRKLSERAIRFSRRGIERYRKGEAA